MDLPSEQIRLPSVAVLDFRSLGADTESDDQHAIIIGLNSDNDIDVFYSKNNDSRWDAFFPDDIEGDGIELVNIVRRSIRLAEDLRQQQHQ